jgi:hypothetical protein
VSSSTGGLSGGLVGGMKHGFELTVHFELNVHLR